MQWPNAGEGTVLEFSVTAKAGASGTYWLALPGGQLQNGSGNDAGLLECGPNGNLVAGNGQPNYVPPGAVRECVDWVAGTPSYSVPGVGYGVPPNIICYRIISLTNSTQ